MLKKIFSFLRLHKLLTLIIVGAVVGAVYFIQSRLGGEETIIHYVTAAAEKGTLITSVSGSGQVSATDQIEITPKTSGDVVTVNIKNGQTVKHGALLVQLDARDAERGIRDAATNLETAKLELEELLAPVDELDLVQAENSLAAARRNLDKLKEDYEQLKIDSEK